MNKEYWNGKKVFVTGGHGFVGQNLMKILETMRQQVDFDILCPTSSEVDLTNESEVDSYFADNKPDIVLHLAGKVGGIAANKAAPGDFFYKNIMMGTLVMHYAYKHGAQKVVALAAGCGYPKHLAVPYTEADFWRDLPDENSIGYSMAKKNLIIQSWTYREQYGFNSVILLPANLYGPHDNFDLETSHVVPALIRKFLEARENGSSQVEVWGTGTASREFLYSVDTAQAIIDMAERVNESGPFNLGTGVETSIKELVETISEQVGFEGEIVWDTTRPDGQPRRFYDMSKFEEALGYVPSTTLSEGIKSTIDWYLQEKM
jgi:nucleoside-diphosphate-sugar epimerase|tara:strand:- start:33214 stop:34167 length:954 start_codon:yes stop_codon:yes gene_type:complete